MAYTYDELHAKTIAELREIAKGLDAEAVKGFSQMNKDHLLPVLAKALKIEMHPHAVVASVRRDLKAKVRQLKKKQREALKAKTYDKLPALRQGIHNLKRELRKTIIKHPVGAAATAPTAAGGAAPAAKA